MSNFDLTLDGHCSGPLFAPIVKRMAARGDNRGPKRVQRVRHRIPPWCSAKSQRRVIAAFYRLAKIYTKALGEQYSVEHIVPLNSRYVSGLHCPANLTVLLEADNRRKGNRWWPDMPERQTEMWA